MNKPIVAPEPNIKAALTLYIDSYKGKSVSYNVLAYYLAIFPKEKVDQAINELIESGRLLKKITSDGSTGYYLQPKQSIKDEPNA